MKFHIQRVSCFFNKILYNYLQEMIPSKRHLHRHGCGHWVRRRRHRGRCPHAQGGEGVCVCVCVTRCTGARGANAARRGQGHRRGMQGQGALAHQTGLVSTQFTGADALRGQGAGASTQRAGARALMQRAGALTQHTGAGLMQHAGGVDIACRGQGHGARSGRWWWQHEKREPSNSLLGRGRGPRGW